MGDSRYKDNLTTLAKRLRPLMLRIAEGAVQANEWDKIIHIVSDGGGATVYDPTAANLTTALAATSSGDMVWMPPCNLSGDFTVPAGVGMISMGNNCVIDGTITLAGNNSHLLGIVVYYSDSSAGEISGVIANNSSGLTYINDCGVDVENTGAGDVSAIKITGAGELYIWNSNVYGNASGGGDGYGVTSSGGICRIFGGRVIGSTLRVSGGTGSENHYTTTATCEGLELWNGSSNDAPPANWNTAAFDDSGWVTPDGNKPNPVSPADGLWVGSTTDGRNVLIRHNFDITATELISATLTWDADDWTEGIYVNGTLVDEWKSSAPYDDHPPRSVDVLAYLVADDDNVIAIYQKNIIAGIDGISWKLEMVVGNNVIYIHGAMGEPATDEEIPMEGDRSAWDVDNYASLHSKDIDDNEPIYHIGPGSNANDVPYWDGDKWVPAPHDVAAGYTIEIEASENLTAGDLVDIWNDGGTEKVRMADTSENYLADGYVIDAVTSGNIAIVYTIGINRELSGMTPGAKQFLTTDGDVTETAPSTSGYVIQEVGIALSATEMKFEPQQIILLK